MTDISPLPDQLDREVTEALAVIANRDTRTAIKIGELDLLVHDAEAWEHRRAAHLARDGRCYRLGSAFEPSGGLGLDAVAFTGWLASGAAGIVLLAKQATASPGVSVAANFEALFKTPAGQLLRAQGVWHRWQWLRQIYQEEVTAFLASPKGRDPTARWRSLKPTARQKYLAANICELLQIELQSFATRGNAFTWILEHEGNPRFLNEPPIPDLTGWLEMFQ